MRFLLINNDSKYVLLFRKTLIRHLLGQGHEVLVLAGDGQYADEIRELGVSFQNASHGNRDVSIRRVVQYKKQITEALRSFHPDVVLTFQAKPNIFGALAAKPFGVPVISMVEGLGDPFILHGPKWWAIRQIERHLYRRAFNYVSAAFFLTEEDRMLFVKHHMVQPEKTAYIPGIGLDLESFDESPLPAKKTVVFAGRLNPSKGVYEFCRLARRVKKRMPDVEFLLCGPEREITLDSLSEYIDTKDITPMGEVADMRPIYARSSLLVLPSYREGFPVCVMEAMACGRPCVAFANPGTRLAIDDGVDGCLAPMHDEEALYDRVMKLLSDDATLASMGRAARLHALKSFGFEVAQEPYLSLLGDLFPNQR